MYHPYIPSYQHTSYDYTPPPQVHGILRRPSFDSTHSGRSSRSSRRVSFADEMPPVSRRRSSFPTRTPSFDSDSSSFANIRYSHPSPSGANRLSRNASSRGRTTSRDIEEEFRAADRKKMLRRQKREQEELVREERRQKKKRELGRKRRVEEERRKREEMEKRRERNDAARRRENRKDDERRRSRRSGREHTPSSRRHSRHNSATDMTHAEAARRASLPYVGGRRYMTPFRAY